MSKTNTLYLLKDVSFYSLTDLPMLFNKVSAIRSNTNGYFDTLDYSELMYAIYCYNKFNLQDWRIGSDMIQLRLKNIITSKIVDVEDVCQKLFGKNIPQISGNISIVGKWKVYSNHFQNGC